MTTELREAIARLRSRLHRGLQEHDDTVLICDALEAHLKLAHVNVRRAMEAAKESIEDNDEAGAYSIIKTALAQYEAAPKFDKVAYQREYMREWRKASKRKT